MSYSTTCLFYLLMDKEKTRYQKIIDGDIEPQGSEKGWANLERRVSFDKMSPEKRREICQKGQKALMELHGKKKTAKESLENILTLKITDEILAGADVSPEIAERLKRDNPNATLYDLIHIVAVGRAVGGSVPAMQYIRDTHGDKPIEKVDITGDIMTESDRAMLDKISRRINEGDDVLIVKDVTNGENTGF